MTKITVKGGTRSSTERTLCESCVRSTVVTGMGQNHRIVKCGMLEGPVPWNVETCSGYRQFGVMPLHEMKEMATIIDLKPNSVGFYTARKWREKKDLPLLPPQYEDDYE